MTPTEKLRQFLSDFLDGDNVNALLGSIGDSAEAIENLQIAVNNQLSISTADGIYLDKRLSAKGIVRNPELGMEDLAYRQMGIEITATKQLTELVHGVLETFYGPAAVRANETTLAAEPYALQDGMDLIFSLEDGINRRMIFRSEDFENINQATAAEVADAITRYILNQNLKAFAQKYTDLDTNSNYVQLFGGARGPYSTVSILGGEAQLYLQFPTSIDSSIGTNDTVWQVTRTVGSTIRVRWIGNTQPNLINVLPGDTVLLYGTGFKEISLEGTYTLTNVRPPVAGPALDSGWFEFDLLEYTLRPVPPNTSPPANSPPVFYSYSVATATTKDIVFFRPVKAVPNSQQRYALAWEAASKTLKVYMPAVTGVVTRDLIGATHLHLLYPSNNFNGSYGSSTDIDSQIEVLSDKAIRYPQNGYDNSGKGGELNWNVPVYLLDLHFSIHNLPANVYNILTTTGPDAFTAVAIDSSLYLAGTKIYVNNPTIASIVVYGADHISNYAIPPFSTYTVTVLDPDNPAAVGGLSISPDSGPQFTTSGTVDIDYVFREDFHTTVITAEPHGISSYVDEFGRNMTTAVAAVTVATVTEDDPEEPFIGAYSVDPTAGYALEGDYCTSREEVVASETLTTLSVSGTLPNSPGILLFDLDKDTQEGPVPYVGIQATNSPQTVAIATASQIGFTLTVNTSANHGAVVGSQVQIAGTVHFNGTYTVTSVPTTTSYVVTSGVSQTQFESAVGTSTTLINNAISTIIVDPSYVFKYTHPVGADITLLSYKTAYVPDADGSDYSTYITGTADGRIYAQEIITKVTALGMKLQFIIIYGNDIGWGNAGGSDDPLNPPTSDKVYIYGQ